MKYTLSYEAYLYTLNSLPNPYTYTSSNLYFLDTFDINNNSIKIGFSLIVQNTGHKNWKIIGDIIVPGKMCPKTGLIIDKINKDVAFNNLKHIYWNIHTGEFYTSITTLIGKYKNKFDSITMSLYKALQNNLDSNYFDIIKKSRNRKETIQLVLNSIDNDLCNKIISEAKELRNNWAVKSYNSTTKGSAIHAIRENNILNDTSKEYQIFSKQYKDCIFYPELLVYSHKYKIAGQIDLVFKYNNLNKYVIVDYKTNEKIEMDNKFNKMLSPFDFLDDCSYNQYTLQLSGYKLLLQEEPSFLNETRVENTGLYIEHIQDNNVNFIQCIDLSEKIFNVLNL